MIVRKFFEDGRKRVSMRDLISREAVLDAVRTECSLAIFDSYGNLTFAGERIIEAIKSVKSVEPERKTGKWLKVVDEETSISTTWHYECSLCESRKGWDDCDYCPNCGAKMRRE